MNPDHPLLFPALVALLAAPALAQSTLSLPYHADVAEGHHGVNLPFGAAGFRTQLLVDAAAIAPNGAVLQSLRLRADRSSLPLAASSVPNVTVALGHSSVAVGAMSDTFANNATGAATVVFQGTVQLPGHSDGGAGPMPWDVVVTFQQPFVFDPTLGQLLIEIVGNNPAGQLPLYWLDAVEGGGAATAFGAAGPLPGGASLLLGVAIGNSLDPRLLTIGSTLDFGTFLSSQPLPGVLVLGTESLASPIDLGLIGAPGNTLWIDPIVEAAHAWTQGFLGASSTFSLNVPNVPSLFDAHLYAQSAVFDAAANPLGLVLSAALDVRIGDPAEVLPVQQLDVPDPSATVGRLLDFGFGAPSYGAVALQLEGVFF